MMRTTTSWRARPISASCAIATAFRASSRPTNAGPVRWEDHLATGRPLPVETRAYLLRLLPMVAGRVHDDTTVLAAVVKSWTEASLFRALSSAPAKDKATTSYVSSARRPNEHAAHDWTALVPQSAGLFVAMSRRDRSR